MADPSQPAGTDRGDPLPWARALRAGDEHALEPWFRAEHPAVWKLCLGLLADPAEAADLAQDALLHVKDHLEHWDPERPYVAWRNTLVANLCRDRLRRLRARREAERGAAQAGLPDRLPHPVASADAAEVREVLVTALAALTPREREVFVLRDLERRSTAETAATLGVTEGTARSLLTLARRRLRGLLAVRAPGLVPEGGEA